MSGGSRCLNRSTVWPIRLLRCEGSIYPSPENPKNDRLVFPVSVTGHCKAAYPVCYRPSTNRIFYLVRLVDERDSAHIVLWQP